MEFNDVICECALLDKTYNIDFLKDINITRSELLDLDNHKTMFMKFYIYKEDIFEDFRSKLHQCLLVFINELRKGLRGCDGIVYAIKYECRSKTKIGQDHHWDSIMLANILIEFGIELHKIDSEKQSFTFQIYYKI